MPRVKKGVTAHRRHKKILKLAKGYRGAKSKQFKKAGVEVNRKMLADLAVNDAQAFAKLVDVAKENL